MTASISTLSSRYAETPGPDEKPVEPIHGAVPVGEALARALKANPSPELKALGEAMEGPE